MTVECPAGPRSAPRGVVALGWIAFALPVGAWIAHLVVCAGYAASTGETSVGAAACRSGAAIWPYHLATVAAAAVCVACGVVAVSLLRSGGDAGATNELRFLGLLALGSSVFNLVLVLAEGSVVVFLHSCA